MNIEVMKLVRDNIKMGSVLSFTEVMIIQQAMDAAMLQGADGNSPVIPDGWVACSERMPEKADEVLCAKEFDGPGDWRQKVGYYLSGKWTVYSASWTPTHWMPLPAAPH
ncbi:MULTISPECIES: DUF551 domain-containing protein [Enterobacter cloacae complex]|uniref:DUF551 domain-containing protein n=1 Tax=Enterobacter cloacae complex TaxID=354276 RepID=UPI00079BB704|nr:DUF551 domain-containing protein [Enterobacter cloacae]SAH78599.1 Protein of uncharacterised function (DUF551) [Enterobacter cloacae]